MGRKEITEKIFDFSCGLLATTVDLVLVSVLYGFEVGTAGYGPPKVARAAERAFEKASELAIDAQTIKRAIWKATHYRLIRRQKRGRKFWQITQEGKRRLRAALPRYEEKRTWDGRLYLISFDIQEKNRHQRDILRRYLRTIGCGMLQISVWLSPCDPRGALREFIEKNHLSGAIIVSDIGKDGSIGEEDLDELIARVYKLDDLNARYEEFIDEVERGKLSKEQIVFRFLSILADDPQLPFELLPYNWQGKKAYAVFQEFNPSK